MLKFETKIRRQKVKIHVWDIRYSTGRVCSWCCHLSRRLSESSPWFILVYLHFSMLGNIFPVIWNYFYSRLVRTVLAKVLLPLFLHMLFSLKHGASSDCECIERETENGRRTDVIQVWSEDWQALVALGLHVMECLQGHIFQMAHNRFLGKVKGEPTAKYWSGIDNEEVKFDTLLTLWRRNFL